MRFFTTVFFIFVLSQPASAQLIPQGLEDSITALTTGLGGVQGVMSNLETTLQSNLPQVQSSLAKTGDSLQTIANFTTTLQNNVTPIIFSSIGVIAAGIVLGSLLANYVFTADTKRNVFCIIVKAAHGAWVASHVTPIKIEEIGL
jgi:ABC-type antimicrobial peptide transport system permease subunit